MPSGLIWIGWIHLKTFQCLKTWQKNFDLLESNQSQIFCHSSIYEVDNFNAVLSGFFSKSVNQCVALMSGKLMKATLRNRQNAPVAAPLCRWS